MERIDPVCPVYSLSAPYAYTKEKCRCAVCTTAHKLRAKIYYERYQEQIKKKRLEYRKTHKEEENRKRREYSKRKPDVIKNQHLVAEFKMTLQQFRDMEAQQGGVCKICLKPPTKSKKFLSVDHDHKTGKVRGLLCNRCNSGIGYFKDNTSLMLTAISYLLKAE